MAHILRTEGHILRYLFLSSILLFAVVSPASGATRIWHEDCEDTVYTEHFLEDTYGSGVQSYWDEMKADIAQSDTSYAGSYSMTYSPFSTGNPHAVIGYGNTVSGSNLSGFNFQDVSARYLYFRWYQKWEGDWPESGGSPCGLNKIVYLNYNGAGDFACWFSKTGDSGFALDLRRGDDYNGLNILNGGGGMVYASSAENTSDGNWHKFEIFIDVGTTGDGNGSIWVAVNDTKIFDYSDLTFNATISSNPMEYGGIPSNVSGCSDVFVPDDAQTYLDDLEIYTLTGPTDIPGSGPSADFAGTPLSGAAPLSVAFSDSSTNTPTKWHWDFGDAAADTSALQNPTFEYDTAGTYTVALTAYNADGSDTETKVGYVTVGAPAITGLSASVSTGTLTASWDDDGAASWTIEAHPATGQSYSIWRQTNSASFPVGATAYDVTVDSPDSSPATTSTGG